MKLQVCEFKRKEKSKLELGVAIVKEYGLCDIDFILDLKGNKVPEIWNYWLLYGPASMIDTEYPSFRVS